MMTKETIMNHPPHRQSQGERDSFDELTSPEKMQIPYRPNRQSASRPSGIVAIRISTYPADRDSHPERVFFRCEEGDDAKEVVRELPSDDDLRAVEREG